MNYLDTFLLSNLALMAYLFSARVPYMLYVTRTLLLSPIAGLLLIISYHKFSAKSALLRLKIVLKLTQFSSDAQSSISEWVDKEKQPLLPSYDAMNGNLYS